jgi:DNA-binding IclR family transcriptional regulator
VPDTIHLLARQSTKGRAKSSGGSIKRAKKSPATGDADRNAVKSLRRAMSIFEAVAASDRPLSVAGIAAATGLARPTAHRIVQTLVSLSYLAQSAIDSKFTMGLRILPLAASALDTNRMRIEALPHLQVLAQRTGMRVNLGVLCDDQVMYLAGVEKPSLPTIYSRFGKTAPVHCCSLGKAILAYLPKEDALRILEARPLVSQTPNSITSMDRLLEELEATRARGYAIDAAEHLPMTFCLAVPIYDIAYHPVGAISITAGSADEVLGNVGAVRHCAELISHLQ